MPWYDVGVNIIRTVMLLMTAWTLAFIFVNPTGSVKKMPVAVITNSQSDKIDLKTCPGGYVIVRRMNYGEKLLRDGMAAKFLMSGSTKDASMQGELEMQTEEVALWEFANLIVEHNLTDTQDVPLNFKIKAHVKMLDPAVGDEIGQLIDAQNAAQDSEEVKNS